MKNNETPGNSRLLEKAEPGFCICPCVCPWNKLKQTKINVSEIAAVSYSPTDSVTGHQAKGLSELHNWSPRDTVPRRGQSKSRGRSAVLCFGLQGLSDLCCDSFFICSKKLAGKFCLFFPHSFLGLLLFSLEIIKLLLLARFANSQRK